jgi:hypothetical protein
LIYFANDLPESVYVNEIFEVQLQVKIQDGTPLSMKLVSCNVTKAFSFYNMTAEIFSSMANSDFNVQKSSLLVVGSRLDSTRTQSETNKQGIARIYVKIKESPVNSEIRLICQSGQAISAPSSRIKIKHPIK